MLRETMCVQRKTRLIPLRIDGGDVAGGTATKNGILEGSEHCTVTENSTGDYTFTFTTPFHRTPVVTGLPITDVSTLRIVSVSNTAVRIEQVGADQTTPLADGDFHLMILGFDAIDQN